MEGESPTLNSGIAIQIIWIHAGNVSGWKCTCFSIILCRVDSTGDLFQQPGTSLVHSDFVKQIYEKLEFMNEAVKIN